MSSQVSLEAPADSIYATPLRTKTFYKVFIDYLKQSLSTEMSDPVRPNQTRLDHSLFLQDTGNITRLEVFLHGGVGQKRKKKTRPDTGSKGTKEPALPSS